AMTQFARKYKVECGVCHTAIPRLTQTGFEFRAAGFRMPNEIGKTEVLDYSNAFGNYDAVRLQARYDLSRTDNAGTVTTRNQLTFVEVTLYPVTGSFLKNYSSLFEISLAPGESPEIENAYVRGNWLAGPGFVSARLGVFHPFEGFGASDRPITIGRTLFQTTAARFNQNTFFTPWGFDEMGLEVGYTYKNSNFRATLFNGLSFSEEEGIVTPATSLSGSDSKTPGRPSYNNKDYQLFFNQVLTENGGGLSAYYYSGRLDLPVSDAEGEFFKNKFDRYAFYGGYPIGPVLLLGGYEAGKDDTFTSAEGYGPRSRNDGWFGELDWYGPDLIGVAGRYDQFNPSNKKERDKIDRVTVAVNKAFGNGLQGIAEYQHQKTQLPNQVDRKVDAFQIRFIWIW
ncbi:MAG TPA: hypothetical protein VGL03_13525, partial [Thermoanaerobaculia bacterium]